VGVTELGPLLPSAMMPLGPYPPNSLGLRLEIQGSFKTTEQTFNVITGKTQPYGVLIVMENVAEVF
jgi:hypothetical protein